MFLEKDTRVKRTLPDAGLEAGMHCTRQGGAHGGGGSVGYPHYGPAYYGRVYGDAAFPEDLGSGGGTTGDAIRIGGAGGGAVRIDAVGDVVLDGFILETAVQLPRS